MPVWSHPFAFLAALAVARATREIADNFLNLYSWDRAVAYGLGGGIGAWAAMGVYSLLLAF